MVYSTVYTTTVYLSIYLFIYIGKCNAIQCSRWKTYPTHLHEQLLPNQTLTSFYLDSLLFYSRQPSASQGHDGGNTNCIFAPANSTPKGNPRTGTNNSQTSRFTPTNLLKKRGGAGPDFSSPTMVSTDISTPGSGSRSGSGSGYASAASNSTRSGTPTASTPSTPPPRHVKRMSAEDHDGVVEVWYQKWWMCGFTDALNLNRET